MAEVPLSSFPYPSTMTTTFPAPRVSVLMTMFNADAYLRPAIESLLAQSYRDFELIIVNDGSTDGSAAVVEGFADPRIRPVHNEGNRGQTACLNQGLALARGEFVARQDADDLSHPDRLRRQMRFLDDHPGIALLGANAEQIDGSGRPLGRTDLPRDAPAIRWANLFDNSLLHSAVIFRAKVISEEFGDYDESFHCSQDYALFSRVARQHGVANLAEPLISIRVHPESMMRSPRSRLEVETNRILRANLSAEFPGRSFSEDEIGILAGFRRGLSPETLPRFRALFDELRADFLREHPKAGRSREFLRTEALQFSRIGYNLLERDRWAAITAYARCIRRRPRTLVELPWPRIIALALLGDSARELHRRIFSSGK
jgi:glycosyltransferase involved in cell wall biosynthesis